jgi:hypothetical protein
MSFGNPNWLLDLTQSLSERNLDAIGIEYWQNL